MIGYHYTSAKNYERIKGEGLIPYPLSHPAIKAEPAIPNKGIWIYVERPDPLSHAGLLLWHATTKSNSHVVLLEVHYNLEDTRVPDGRTLSLYHDLSIEHRVFHVAELARIIFSPVVPEDVVLIESHKALKPLSMVAVHEVLIRQTRPDREKAHRRTWREFNKNPRMVESLP